jgi:hypothetical protein
VILVGGEAVTYHGYAPFTGDLDLFYDRSPDRAARTYAALAGFWGGSVPAVAGAADREDEDEDVQFGRPPNRVDLFSRLPGVPFEEAWARPVTSPSRSSRSTCSSGTSRSWGRPKDQDDVEHLTAQRRRRPPGWSCYRERNTVRGHAQLKTTAPAHGPDPATDEPTIRGVLSFQPLLGRAFLLC